MRPLNVLPRGQALAVACEQHLRAHVAYAAVGLQPLAAVVAAAYHRHVGHVARVFAYLFKQALLRRRLDYHLVGHAVRADDGCNALYVGPELVHVYQAAALEEVQRLVQRGYAVRRGRAVLIDEAQRAYLRRAHVAYVPRRAQMRRLHARMEHVVPAVSRQGHVQLDYVRALPERCLKRCQSVAGYVAPAHAPVRRNERPLLRHNTYLRLLP